MSAPAGKSIHVTTAPLRIGGQQDNQYLPEKLALRRYFLTKYPMPRAKSFRVIDCCAGEKQAIWTQLRQEYAVQYLGLDKKRVGGAIVKITAERWLAQTAWEADVVDIDTYGEPWVIWEALLESFKGEEITVFLTYCNVPVNNAVGRMSQVVRQRIGIPEGWKIWHSRVIAPFTMNAMLAYAIERGFKVIEAARIRFTYQPGIGVRWDWNELYLYMGLRLRWTA